MSNLNRYHNGGRTRLIGTDNYDIDLYGNVWRVSSTTERPVAIQYSSSGRRYVRVKQGDSNPTIFLDEGVYFSFHDVPDEIINNPNWKVYNLTGEDNGYIANYVIADKRFIDDSLPDMSHRVTDFDWLSEDSVDRFEELYGFDRPWQYTPDMYEWIKAQAYKMQISMLKAIALCDSNYEWPDLPAAGTVYQTDWNS